MITTTVGQLVNATGSIKNVLGAKLPIKVAWQLGKIGKAITKELEQYEELRQKFCVEFGVLSENGNTYSFIGDNQAKFAESYKELLSVKVQIDLLPIKVSDLGEKVEVAAADLMACESFIVE